MDEEALKDAYKLFVATGYDGDINKFKNLISTNNDALNDAHKLFVATGYDGDINKFKNLLGIGFKKKGKTIALPSKDGSLVSQKPIPEAPVPNENDFSYGDVQKPIEIQPFIKNKPLENKPLPPQTKQQDFQSRIKKITPELIGKEEKYVVPELNYQFKEHGFKFEESTPMADAMTVTAPNGKVLKIDLDPFTTSGEVMESDKLKKFISENSIKYDKLNKVTAEQSIYNKRVSDEKEINNLTNRLKTDISSFQYEIQQLNLLTEGTPEYENKRNELVAKQNKLQSNQKELERSVGKYVEMKESQGTYMGHIRNQLIEGATSIAAGLVGFGLDAASLVSPVPVSDISLKQTKKDVLPFVRNSLNYFKDETTKEYGASLNFVGSAVGGLARSIIPMLSGEGLPITMAAQISDDLDQEMASNPDFENISEQEKLVLKVPMMIGGAMLEKYGLRNTIESKGLLNNIVLTAIGQSTKNITAKSFGELLEQNIKSRIAKGTLKIGAGGLAEFETGASQELLDIGTKNIYNAVKEKEMFQTPETFGDIGKQVITAGLQEAIGGLILSAPSAIKTAFKDNDFTKLSDIDIEVLKISKSDVEINSLIETSLENKVASGEITADEAKEILTNFRETVGLLNSTDTEGLTNEEIKEKLSLVKELQGLEQKQKPLNTADAEELTDKITLLKEAIKKIKPKKQEILINKEATKTIQKEAKDFIGKEVEYNGKKGVIIQDEGGKLTFENDTQIIEIGKSEIVKEIDVPKLEVKGNSVIIGNEQFEFVSTNTDNNGAVVSVTLKTQDGRTITKRDSELALDIGIAKNNEMLNNAEMSPKQISESETTVDNEFVANYGQTVNDILESMPEEVLDIVTAMDNNILTIEPDQLQEMALRSSEWADSAVQKINNSNSSEIEKKKAISMINKFNKDLEIYYGKIEQKKQSKTNTNEQGGKAKNTEPNKSTNETKEKVTPVRVNGINAIDDNGNVSKEFSDKIKLLKENNDKEGLNDIYSTVNILLNGVAQSKGENTVKALEGIKRDLESFAQQENDVPKAEPKSAVAEILEDDIKEPLKNVKNTSKALENIANSGININIPYTGKFADGKEFDINLSTPQVYKDFSGTERKGFKGLSNSIIPYTVVSEAYHKAKSDGSNTKLVEAIEDLFSKPQVQSPKVAETKEEAIKTNETPKKSKPSILKNISKKYNKLDELTPRTLVLRFFATGGKVSSKEAMKRTRLGTKDLWGKVAKTGLSYHQLFESIADELGLELQDIDQYDFDNMVDSLISGSKNAIFEELNEHLPKKDESVVDLNNMSIDELKEAMKDVDHHYHDWFYEQIGELERHIQDELFQEEAEALDKHIEKYTINGIIDWDAVTKDKEIQQLTNIANERQDTKTESDSKRDSTTTDKKETIGQQGEKKYIITENDGLPFVSESGDDNYPVADILQREKDSGKNPILSIKVAWNKFKHISFTGSTKVKNASDVAHIMRLLESKSVEHSFAVHIDSKGNSHIQFLGIGSIVGTIIDPRSIISGVAKFNSKKIYLVHNHPSGTLTPSRQDIQITNKIRSGLDPLGIKLEHIIMDTYSKQYVHIDYLGDVFTKSRELDKNDFGKLTTHIMDEQTILGTPFGKVSSSKDAVEFIQQLRFTAMPKNAVLLLNVRNEIVANYIFKNKIDFKQLTQLIGKVGISTNIILYGNSENRNEVESIRRELNNISIGVLDYIVVNSNGIGVKEYYKSLADEGLLGETQEMYGTNSIGTINNNSKETAKRIRDKKLKGIGIHLDFGITKTIYNGALEIVAREVEKGSKLGNAINKAIQWVDSKIGKNWNKGAFARYLNDKFKVNVNGEEIEVERDNSKPTAELINGFYSPLEAGINKSKLDKATGKEWLKRLQGETEADELKWTGVGKYLAENGDKVISKNNLLDYFKTNRIEIVEEVKGTPREINENSKYAKDPILRKLFNEANSEYDFRAQLDNDIDLYNHIQKKYGNVNSDFIADELWKSHDEPTKFHSYQLEGEKENYREVLVMLPFKQPLDFLSPKKRFTSSHWDEPNILVHLRISNRIDSGGDKVLHISEIQSDYGQTGKREGFKTEELSWDSELGKRAVAAIKDMDNLGFPTWQEAARAIIKSNDVVNDFDIKHEYISDILKWRTASKQETKIPSAPFVTDTNSWVKLGLKVALQKAVQDGATKITWETGETQNARYDLSKQVDYITKNNAPEGLLPNTDYVDISTKDGMINLQVDRTTGKIIQEYGNGRVGAVGKNLEDIVGKDVAQKIMESKDGSHLEGNDLKIGGKGMIGFYGSPTEGKHGIVGEVIKSLTGQTPSIVKIDTGNVKLTAIKYDSGNIEQSEVVDQMPGSEYIQDGDWLIKDSKGEYLWHEDGKLTKEEAIKSFKDAALNTGNPITEGEGLIEQYSIDITPELKKSIESGIPLFKGLTPLNAAKKAFQKAMNEGMSSGGFHALPEFINLVKEYIKYGITTSKEFFDKLKQDLPDVKFDRREAIKVFKRELKTSPPKSDFHTLQYFINKVRNQSNILKRKEFAKQVKDFLDNKDWYGKIGNTRIRALINKAININTQKDIDKFLKYADKVINDANYNERINKIKKLQSLANRVKHTSFKSAVKSFTSINPELIPDNLMDDYIQALDELTSRTPAYNTMARLFSNIENLKVDKEFDEVKSLESAQAKFDEIFANKITSVEDYRKLVTDINSLRKKLDELLDNNVITDEQYDDILKQIGSSQKEIEDKFESEIKIIKTDIVTNLPKLDTQNLSEEEQAIIDEFNSLNNSDLMELSPEKLFILNDLINNINTGEFIDVYRLEDVISDAVSSYQAKHIAKQANKSKATKKDIPQMVKKLSTQESAFWEGILGLGRSKVGAYGKFITSAYDRAVAMYHETIYKGQSFYSKLIKKHKIKRESKYKIGLIVNYLQEYMAQFDPKNSKVENIGNRDWWYEISNTPKEIDEYSTDSSLRKKSEKQTIENAYNSLPKIDGKVSPKEVYDSYMANDGKFLTKNEHAFLSKLFEYKETNLKEKQRIANEISGLPFTEVPFHMMRIRMAGNKDITPSTVQSETGNVRIKAGTGKERTSQKISAIEFNIDKMFLKGLEQTSRDYYFTKFLKTFNRTLSKALPLIKDENQKIIKATKNNIVEALNYEFNRTQGGFAEKGLRTLMSAQAASALFNPIRTFLKELPASFITYPLRANTVKGYKELMSVDGVTKELIKLTDSPLLLRDNINKALETDVGDIRKESPATRYTTWLSGLPERVMLKTVWQPIFDSSFKDITGEDFNRSSFMNNKSYRDKYRKAIKESGSEADLTYAKIVGTTTKGSSNRNINIFGKLQPLDTPLGQIVWFFNRYPYRELNEFINGFKEVKERLDKGDGLGSLTSLNKPIAIVLNTMIYGYATSLVTAASMMMLGDDEEKKYGEDMLKRITTLDGFLDDLKGNLVALGIAGRYGLIGRAMLQGTLSIAYNNAKDEETKRKIREFLRQSVFLDVTKASENKYAAKQQVAYTMINELPALSLVMNRTVEAAGGVSGIKKLYSDYEEKGLKNMSEDDKAKWILLDATMKATQIALNIQGTSLPMYKDLDRYVRKQTTTIHKKNIFN